MTIKNKLILMLAIPLVALALVAFFGFRDQSALAEVNEDVQEVATALLALDDLAQKVATERLAIVASSGAEAVADAEAETDAALDAIIGSNGEIASPVASEVASKIAGARRGGMTEYSQILNDIEAAIGAQPLAGFSADSVIALEALQSARDVADTQEESWINFFALEEVTPRDLAQLTNEFGHVDFILNVASNVTLSNDIRPFQGPSSSADALALNRFQGNAVEDLFDNTPDEISPADVYPHVVENRAQWAEASNELSAFIAADAAARGDQIDDRRSLFTLLAVLGVFLLFTLIFVIGRSILGPMNRLMDHADLMTTERLPFAVAKLRTLGASDELPELRPIPKESDDEIGSLVDAFNEVQDTAVRVATDQARSRRNVAEMFVSLGRRNQQLNHRMLNLISELEQDEQDPEVLNGLYQLDHLATRMRRNAESLLVLAGNRSPRQWSRPVAMEDVVRSALAEVELFERVEIGDLPENFMHGNVVTDVTHLLAELLDNATQFSEPSTAVSISAHETLEGVEIEVFDEGFGVNEHDLAELNERISNPPALDEAPSRLLGLFVVGRLAQQHGIDVHLQSQPGVGTVATVALPSSMFPEEIVERSTGILPPTGAMTQPAIESAEIDGLREDLAELASIDTGEDTALIDDEDASSWNPAAVHDEHLADASVPTMDEMIDAMPSFPGVTIDHPAEAQVAEAEHGDAWPLAHIEPGESDPAEVASTFSALEAIVEPEPVVEIVETSTVETPTVETPTVEMPAALDPFSLAPPLDGAPPVVEAPVAEVPMAPPVVEAPVAEVPMAPPVVQAPAPIAPAVSPLPAPPIMDAPAPAAPPAAPEVPAEAAPLPVAEVVQPDTFGGLPTRSPQAALDAVDATPELIPLDTAMPSETPATPAPPSAFAAFAFGVNRGLSEVKDEPKPQFSSEGDNA